MLKQYAAVFFVIAWACSASAQDLARGFVDPPREYSMAPLWSWNGTLEPGELRRQIDQMVDKGVYGAFMHARAGIETGTTPYFSEGWWNAVDACVKHGAEVGFRTWIYDEDKWPSGAAGGRTIARNPEQNRQKGFRLVEEQISGPVQLEINIPGAEYIIAGKLTGRREMKPGSLMDLSRFNSGAPGAHEKNVTKQSFSKGDWLLIGYIPASGEGVNYLNKDTVRDFMDITHEEYYRRFGDYFGTTIPGVFFDEIHNRGLPMAWPEGFAERFRALKGYDLPPLLPALTYDIGPMTPKVRCDYYDVFTTFYEEAWFQQISKWCAEHRLELTGHTEEGIKAYTNQGDYFCTMRHLQIPMTDNEDFRYTWPRVVGPWKPKQIASICHLYGREQIAVEAMGGAGWSFTLDSARHGFNMLAAYGINFFYPHLFHYAQDNPVNVDDWPNSWFFRNPYWKYFKTFADHGRRLSYMLTGGKHIVEVAILYPQANLWAGYGPGTTVDALTALVANHIDTDLIDPDSLLRAITDGGALCVSDMRYRVLIVPGVRCIRRDEAAKIRRFVECGGTVIVHNRWSSESMDKGRDDHVIKKHMQKIEAHGITVTKCDDVVEQVAVAIGRDIQVAGGHPENLRYQHVQREGKDVYWLANESNESREWNVTFRATGAASIWQPEDGSITPLPVMDARDGRTQCDVHLDGWQGCFVVFDPATPPQHENAVASSVSEEKVVDLTEQPWRFLAVGDVLDEVWRANLEESEFELPVMKVRWEFAGDKDSDAWKTPQYGDDTWRKVKILDTLHSLEGANRYRSAWRARFVSFYDVLEFNAVPGGKGLQCRTTCSLPAPATSGHLSIICDSAYRLILNGAEIGSGEGGAPKRFDLPASAAGDAVLQVAAKNSRAILAEGEWTLSDETRVPLQSNAAWEVSMDGDTWCAAWEYVAPPEKPYGEPRHPDNTPMPEVVWYRQALPPGTVEIQEPNIEGDWKAWVNDKPLGFKNGAATLPAAATAVLAIRVRIQNDQHGLMTPVIVRCRKSEQPLGSWTNQNLDWYSGRAIYSTTFEMKTAPPSTTRVMIDLGKVCYCAEVWVNGKLAGTRIWPPYTVDISEHVKPGENQIDIVAANLLANRMSWDIFDDVKCEPVNRKWHDGNIRRDGWCLESGLVGPVRLLLIP